MPVIEIKEDLLTEHTTPPDPIKAFKQTMDDVLWLVARDLLLLTTTEKSPGWELGILCSDTFCYGCADAEDIELAAISLFRSFYERYGDDGLTTWCAVSRGKTPLKPCITPNYLKAVEELKRLYLQLAFSFLHKPYNSENEVDAIVGELHGFLLQEETCWTSYCRELNVTSCGATEADAIKAIQEVIRVYCVTIDPSKVWTLGGLTVDNHEWWRLTLTVEK